ncbi:MAG: DUF2934 domain-containing protein [Pseudomonadota bacterium]|jgi:hypothetical protein
MPARTETEADKPKKRAAPKSAANADAPAKTTRARRTSPVRPRDDDAVNAEERLRYIAEAAYYRAEKRGFAPGGELDDWLEAEAEVDSRLARRSIN